MTSIYIIFKLKKKKNFSKRCLANSLTIGNEIHYSSFEGIAHISDPPRVCEDVLKSLETMANRQCSRLVHAATVIPALWLLLNLPNFYTNSKHSHVFFRDTWHFPMVMQQLHENGIFACFYFLQTWALNGKLEDAWFLTLSNHW